MKIRVKKGDVVRVLSGKDRGKSGIVDHVSPKFQQVVVGGVNLHKKHARPRRRVPHGGIVDLPGALPISRVMVICSRCQKPTRVKVLLDESGRRHRACRHCQEMWI